MMIHPDESPSPDADGIDRRGFVEGMTCMQAGDFACFCSRHPPMTGKVAMKPGAG